MRVFVTGATGFLGKHVARALAERGHTVTCLVRKTSRRTGLDRPGIQCVVGDVTDRGSIERALAEPYDAVMHMAALVRSWVPRAEAFEEVNVEGFRNVIETALEMDVPRIVYTSSFFALGPTDGFIGDETTHHDPNTFCHEYERTKYLADCDALALMEQGQPLVTLYPGTIYGPGEVTEGNIVVGLLIDFLTKQPWLLRKMPGVLGNGHQRWSYCFIDDVVDGHLAALVHGAAGERYVLAGDNVSLLGLQKHFADVTGLRPFTMKLPFAVGRLAGLTEEIRARVGSHTPFNTRGTVEIFRHDWAYSSDKASMQLGYQPRSLRDGLAETYTWVQRQGLVARPRFR